LQSWDSPSLLILFQPLHIYLEQILAYRAKALIGAKKFYKIGLRSNCGHRCCFVGLPLSPSTSIAGTQATDNLDNYEGEIKAQIEQQASQSGRTGLRSELTL
jgi:hypothetical protein